MKYIKETPSFIKNPHSLKEIWFQHHSPIKLKIISPQTYQQILDLRREDMSKISAYQYIIDRLIEENDYRSKLDSDNNKSFNYATIVGFNKMEAAETYPGFTYFFKLKLSQIENTLFGVIGGKPKLNLEPELGTKALYKSLSYWKKNESKFKSYDDPNIGTIDPRIEVIIPYEITPLLVIPEIEQR